MPPVPDTSNHTVLEGVLTQTSEWRVTPGGLPMLRLELEHLSTPLDLAPLERVELRLPIVALGELAETCRHIPPGTRLRIVGVLNQKRWIRDGKTRWGAVELVARSILRLDGNDLIPTQPEKD